LNVVAFFVDIVVIESGEIDSIGVDIANRLHDEFPKVLTFNVTGKVNFKKN
jgi:4-hydroxy-L-threonine phosphate dehydrogenase PdxA